MNTVEGNGGTSPTPEALEASQKSEARVPAEIVPNPLTDDLRETHQNRGVLIPLKTTQEVRQDHTIVQAFITRAPVKQANEVITFVSRSFLHIPSCDGWLNRC